jgi:hypothetical protein
MFEKKKKSDLDFKGPKNTTFGNDSDSDEQESEEVENVDDFMKMVDGEIKTAKQNEKNASVARVYSTQSAIQKVSKNINACGCFGG